MITSEPNGSGSQFAIFRVTITQDLAQILKVGCLITCEANLTYYTKNSVYETTSGGQLKRVDETFSSCFLNNLTCDVTGATAPTLVEDWETLETAYDSIEETYKNSLQIASYTVSGSGADTVVTATGTTKQLVAEAMYKYDIITTKYSQYTNFITSRTPLVAINGFVQPINQNSTAAIIVISFFGLTALGGLFFLKRRKE